MPKKGLHGELPGGKKILQCSVVRQNRTNENQTKDLCRSDISHSPHITSYLIVFHSWWTWSSYSSEIIFLKQSHHELENLGSGARINCLVEKSVDSEWCNRFSINLSLAQTPATRQTHVLCLFSLMCADCWTSLSTIYYGIDGDLFSYSFKLRLKTDIARIASHTLWCAHFPEDSSSGMLRGSITKWDRSSLYPLVNLPLTFPCGLFDFS